MNDEKIKKVEIVKSNKAPVFSSSDFFDFEFEIRNNTMFADKVNAAIHNIIKTNDDLKRNAGQAKYRALRDEAFTEYLKLTKFNITPLLGYFFPKYPTVKPFSLQNYPFAHVFYNLNLGGNSFTCIKGSRQISKCVTGDTIIKVRNKRTKEIKEISLQDFFRLTK